jgi:vacuolar-type H+-ATPase subunit H
MRQKASEMNNSRHEKAEQEAESLLSEARNLLEEYENWAKPIKPVKPVEPASNLGKMMLEESLNKR